MLIRANTAQNSPKLAMQTFKERVTNIHQLVSRCLYYKSSSLIRCKKKLLAHHLSSNVTKNINTMTAKNILKNICQKLIEIRNKIDNQSY